MTYSKFPAKKRKSTGIRWWTDQDGSFVELTEGNDLAPAGTVFAVTRNADTDSGLVDRLDRPVVWPSIRTLVLASRFPQLAVVYGCADCDYAALHHYQVRPHRNAHRDLKPTATGTALAVADLKAIIENAAAAEKRIQRLTADRDAWRKRALAAEGDLAAINKAFNRARQA